MRDFLCRYLQPIVMMLAFVVAGIVQLVLRIRAVRNLPPGTNTWEESMVGFLRGDEPWKERLRSRLFIVFATWFVVTLFAIFALPNELKPYCSK